MIGNLPSTAARSVGRHTWKNGATPGVSIIVGSMRLDDSGREAVDAPTAPAAPAAPPAPAVASAPAVAVPALPALAAFAAPAVPAGPTAAPGAPAVAAPARAPAVPDGTPPGLRGEPAAPAVLVPGEAAVLAAVPAALGVPAVGEVCASVDEPSLEHAPKAETAMTHAVRLFSSSFITVVLRC
jgi:hypothetical protein